MLEPHRLCLRKPALGGQQGLLELIGRIPLVSMGSWSGPQSSKLLQTSAAIHISRGMGANCSCSPLVCKTSIDLQPAPHGGTVEMNPVAYEQGRKASVIFPGYRTLVMNECFIFYCVCFVGL